MIPEINLVDDWGIVEGTVDPEITTRAMSNSCKFLTNFEALSGPAKLFLPAGTYEFNMIFLLIRMILNFVEKLTRMVNQSLLLNLKQ